jgi:hypothetical protein
MIYVVTWIITNLINGGCPLYYTTDDYGRRIPKDHKYMIHCWDIKKTEMKKEFSDRDSAVAFYSRAYNNPKVDSLRMDSVHITALKK